LNFPFLIFRTVAQAERKPSLEFFDVVSVLCSDNAGIGIQQEQEAPMDFVAASIGDDTNAIAKEWLTGSDQ